MKKIITLVLLTITLASCSSEESVAETTIATKYVEKRTETINYSTAAIISDTGFIANGTTEFYSNNSDDCGKIVFNSTENSITTLNGVKVQINTSYRHVIKCQ